MKRPFAALLLLGACACDAPSIADPPISKVEKPNQEKSQEDRREHEAGFWLSRRGQGKYEIVVVSLNKPESGDDATAIASGQIGLNQDFARAAIGRKLEKGERVYAYGFRVVKSSGPKGPRHVGQYRERDGQLEPSLRGFWIESGKNGGISIVYLRKHIRRGSDYSSERVSSDFVERLIGREPGKGETFFLSKPKVENAEGGMDPRDDPKNAARLFAPHSRVEGESR